MSDMYEIVDAGFGYAELEPEPAVIWRHPMPDGREATVTQTRLCLGRHGNLDGADVYCYATSMSAVLSAALWIEADCAAEPDGWTSHVGTGGPGPPARRPPRAGRATSAPGAGAPAPYRAPTSGRGSAPSTPTGCRS